MKAKVAWIVVGLLVGMLVASVMPAGAHHSRSTQRLQDRVHRLEAAFERGCGFGEAVTWGSSLGNSFGDPTLKCAGIRPGDINTPSGCSGRTATWTSSGLSC